ncbi:MAG: class I SAM-dependent methyltransferase [Nitrospinota bacterium]|nr:class I SAM-dependent methyltransferase [Nitrospinota bacterium]
MSHSPPHTKQELPTGGKAPHRRAVQEYFDVAAREYGQKSEQGAWGWLKNAEFDAVARQLGAINGLDVLEAGCGAGWYAKRLAGQRPRTYVALDALYSMAAKARSAGVDTLVADSMALPFKAGFDVVLCAGALEFMESPALFFIEAAAALRPGGRAVILAPSKSVAGGIYRWWHRRHGFEIHLFSQEDIGAMAQGAGLRLASVSSAGLFNLAARLEKPA